MAYWKNYLRTAAATVALAGLPTFVAYAHYDTSARIERATSAVERLYSQEQELLDDIRIKEGWHLCGMETRDEHRSVYRKVRATPEFKAWESKKRREERRLLNDLVCDRSMITSMGLITDWFKAFYEEPLETLFRSRSGEFRALEEHVCNYKIGGV